MASARIDRRPGQGASAVSLVECSVRVSSALARLIRKTAEEERQGLSPTDALLKIIGIQPGEIANLQRQLQRAQEEGTHLREKAARDHSQLDQLRRRLAEQDKEKAAIALELRDATNLLQRAQQELITMERRMADLTSTVGDRERQLAVSVSISSLDEPGAAATKLFRDRLADRDLQFTSAREAEAVIANLGRPEMRNLSNILTRQSRRIHVLRWLLGVRTSG